MSFLAIFWYLQESIEGHAINISPLWGGESIEGLPAINISPLWGGEFIEGLPAINISPRRSGESVHHADLEERRLGGSVTRFTPGATL